MSELAIVSVFPQSFGTFKQRDSSGTFYPICSMEQSMFPLELKNEIRVEPARPGYDAIRRVVSISLKNTNLNYCHDLVPGYIIFN